MLIVEVLVIFVFRIDVGWNTPGELCDLRMDRVLVGCLEPREVTVNNFCHGHPMALREFLYKSDLIGG